jgi:hypothetical protein
LDNDYRSEMKKVRRDEMRYEDPDLAKIRERTADLLVEYRKRVEEVTGRKNEWAQPGDDEQTGA